MRKFLFILFSSLFFIPGLVLAYTTPPTYSSWTSNNFNDATAIENYTGYWGSGGVANCPKNLSYDSDPGAGKYGVRMSYDNTNRCSFHIGNQTSTSTLNLNIPSEYSFKFKITVSGATDKENLLQIQARGVDNLFILGLYYKDSAYGFYSSTQTSWVDGLMTAEINNLAVNTWHTATLYISHSVGQYRLKVGTELSDWIDFASPVDTYGLTELYFRGNELNKDYVYIDDFVYNAVAEADNVEVIENNDLSGNIFVANEYLEYPLVTQCQINNDCDLVIKYPYSYDGKTLGLKVFWSSWGDGEWIDTAVLGNTDLYKTTLTAPAVSTVGRKEYCLGVLDSHGQLEQEYCGFYIEWTSKSRLELMGLAPYNIDDACAHVATSTGSTWDDLRYAFECGGNKIIYWSFHPSDEALIQADDAKNDLLNGFPINVYRMMYSNLRAKGDMSTVSTFQLPLYVGIFGGASTTINVLSLEKIDAIFGDHWDNFYTFMTWIIWFMTFIYLFNNFVGLNRDASSAMDSDERRSLRGRSLDK